jgi:hypothetical protein
MTTPKVLIPMIRNIMPQIIAHQIIGVQPMIKNTVVYSDKVYNRKYWPYQYRIGIGKIDEAERWCWARFPGKYWHSDLEQFVFKRQEDAVLFRLAWQ